MDASLNSATAICNYLATYDIEAILYGSLGASVYLGPFKSFGDIDLLIDQIWLDNKWPALVDIMHDNGFELIDLREHEFRNNRGLLLAFAGKPILSRDGIITSPHDIVTIPLGSSTLITLTPEAFKRAYEFSKKDGYRRDVRNKKDNSIIELLSTYIANHQ